MYYKFKEVIKKLNNKKNKFEPTIKVERRFSIETNKNYGVCFYLEGHIPSDFRRRLSNFDNKDVWFIVYKKKGPKLVLDGLITKDEDKIKHIEENFEVVKKILLSYMFYIDIYFNDKELAVLFESLFINMYKRYIDDRYKEYHALVTNEKEDWLKKNN